MRRGSIAIALLSGMASGSAGSPACAQRAITEIVSVDSAGNFGDHISYWPLPCANGRLVLFVSRASNLVPGDTNGADDVFVRDRRSGTTECLSVDATGNPANNASVDPSVSTDGRYVAFASAADNLVNGDTNGRADVFVRDRQTGITTMESVDSTGVQANNGAGDPAISADGRFLVFMSNSTNLVPADTNKKIDVFLRDRQTGTIERVSVDSLGAQGNDDSNFGQVSADGRYVVFWSLATNLVPGDTNGDSDVFVHDRQSGATQRVSVDSAGIEANAESGGPSLSADGRYVGFWSMADDLVAGDANGYRDAFVHDCLTGATERVSVDSDEVEGWWESFGPKLSQDGRFACFDSLSDNLVYHDTNQTTDCFVRDRLLGTTVRVTLDSTGAQIHDGGSSGRISADGRFVAFMSWSDDLAPGDTNGWSDDFIHGPSLILECDPAVVSDGSTLSLTTWRGAADGVSLLAMTDVAGTPVFVPALLGTFDASGLWLVQTTVPPGLAGNAITFEAFGFITIDKIGGTNPVVISFQ